MDRLLILMVNKLKLVRFYSIQAKLVLNFSLLTNRESIRLAAMLMYRCYLKTSDSSWSRCSLKLWIESQLDRKRCNQQGLEAGPAIHLAGRLDPALDD